MPTLRRTLPPLGTLLAFDTVGRLGSFTRAAAELHLSQSAVSQQIRQLEDDLHTPLFVRRRHDVTLTRTGERFARTVGVAIRQIADASEEMRAGAAATQRLIVFTEMCFAAHWLMPRLNRFQSRYPALDVKLLTSNRSAHHEPETFHVAIQYGGPSSRGYRLRPLCGDDIIPVCSPAFRKTLPNGVTVADLAHAKLIHLEQPERDWTDWGAFFISFGVVHKVQRQGHLTFNTYLSAVEAAIEGHGLVLGWCRSIDKPLKDGSLVPAGDFSFSAPQDISLHVTEDARYAKQTIDFISWLEEELAL